MGRFDEDWEERLHRENPETYSSLLRDKWQIDESEYDQNELAMMHERAEYLERKKIKPRTENDWSNLLSFIITGHVPKPTRKDFRKVITARTGYHAKGRKKSRIGTIHQDGIKLPDLNLRFKI